MELKVRFILAICGIFRNVCGATEYEKVVFLPGNLFLAVYIMHQSLTDPTTSDCQGQNVMKAFVPPQDDLIDVGQKIPELSMIMKAGVEQGSEVLFRNASLSFTFFGPSNDVFKRVRNNKSSYVPMAKTFNFQLSNASRYEQLYHPESSGPVASMHYTFETFYLSTMPVGSVTLTSAGGSLLHVTKDPTGKVQESSFSRTIVISG